MLIIKLRTCRLHKLGTPYVASHTFYTRQKSTLMQAVEIVGGGSLQRKPVQMTLIHFSRGVKKTAGVIERFAKKQVDLERKKIAQPIVYVFCLRCLNGCP